MENKETCKDEQGLVPNDFRSGRERRRERREQLGGWNTRN